MGRVGDPQGMSCKFDALSSGRLQIIYPGILVDTNLAPSRYDDDDELDESRPIPDTKDGLLYYCWPGRGEHLTIEDAKKHADAEPWGPVIWDIEISD